MLRNPKDMLVSSYKFVRSLIGDKYTGTFDELFELFMSDQFWMEPWWDHVNEYTKLASQHSHNPLREFTRSKILELLAEFWVKC